MTEFDLFQALRPLYPEREYALLPQVANGTGAGTDRHCDALALGLWPSRGLYLSGFEIKSYRNDWLRELKRPAKAEEFVRYCNYWWIVAESLEIVKLEELPRTWGLFVFDGKKGALRRAKAAVYNNAAKATDLAFMAAILRKAQECCTPAAALGKAYQDGLKKGRDERAAENRFDLEQYKNLREQVKAFETASGLKFPEWGGGKELGAAVDQVFNGTAHHHQQQLLATARTILRQLGEPDDTATAPETLHPIG